VYGPLVHDGLMHCDELVINTHTSSSPRVGLVQGAGGRLISFDLDKEMEELFPSSYRSNHRSKPTKSAGKADAARSPPIVATD
jgi:hypothetical protein